MNKEVELKDIVESVTRWGIPVGKGSLQISLLKKDLINLYAYCLSLEDISDEQDFPDYDRQSVYETVYKQVGINFPSFGYYWQSTTNISTQPEILTGDATDDLADIISDLLEVQWHLQNNCLEDALRFLKFSFENHAEVHIISLLKYLKSNEIR